MKRFVWATALVISILGWREPLAQTNPPRVIAEFTGASLKWIHVAQPEFQRRKLNLDNYTVRVVERDDSVVVSLSAPDAVKGTRGSSGRYPAFEVEIDKKDLKVVRSNYVRRQTARTGVITGCPDNYCKQAISLIDLSILSIETKLSIHTNTPTPKSPF
jgi:hypothetical protein